MEIMQNPTEYATECFNLGFTLEDCLDQLSGKSGNKGQWRKDFINAFLDLESESDSEMFDFLDGIAPALKG